MSHMRVHAVRHLTAGRVGAWTGPRPYVSYCGAKISGEEFAYRSSRTPPVCQDCLIIRNAVARTLAYRPSQEHQ